MSLVSALFGKGPSGFGFGSTAEEVSAGLDLTGRVILLTTTKEHAELKQDQIHAFGPDPLIPRCKGSMSATIEPAPG